MTNYALTFYDAADRFAESESIACEDDVRALVTAIQRLRSTAPYAAVDISQGQRLIRKVRRQELLGKGA